MILQCARGGEVMPRDNPKSSNDPKSRDNDVRPPRAADRSTGDQGGAKTVSSATKTAASAASVTTGDAEAQSPLGARQDRPPDSTYSFETSPANPASIDTGPGRDVVERDASRSPQGTPDEKPSSKSERDEREGGDAPDASTMSGWKGMVIVAIVALICGAASAWAYTELLGPSKSQNKSSADRNESNSGQKGGGPSDSKKPGGKQASSADQKGDAGKNKSADSGSEIPGFTSADDAETLKKQINHLSQRVDRINQRLDSVKKPEGETPPGLHTLQVRVTELTKDLDETAELPAQFRDLEHRLSSLEQQVKSLRPDAAPESSSPEKNQSQDRSPSDADGSPSAGDAKTKGASALQDDAAPPADADEAGSSDEAPSEEGQPDEADVNDDDATMDLGAELFENGRYAQARDVFRRLQKERPHDARVWYYSALANGLVTHVWDGETQRLFEKGAERERAGTPARERISAAFEKLNSSKAKEELSHYRQGVAKAPAGKAGSNSSDRYRLTNESLKVP